MARARVDHRGDCSRSDAPPRATRSGGEQAGAGGQAIRWVVGIFVAAQTGILAMAPSGPFVDEGLYVVAGLRVLEGRGLSDYRLPSGN